MFMDRHRCLQIYTCSCIKEYKVLFEEKLQHEKVKLRYNIHKISDSVEERITDSKKHTHTTIVFRGMGQGAAANDFQSMRASLSMYGTR